MLLPPTTDKDKAIATTNEEQECLSATASFHATKFSVDKKLKCQIKCVSEESKNNQTLK